MRQSLILLCEAHFALLYILQIHLVSSTLEQKGSLSKEVLSQLGMQISYMDILNPQFCKHGYNKFPYRILFFS